MSILSRVNGWLRSELNARFGRDSWPREPPAGRRQAGSASAPQEPGAGRQPRPSNTGAGPDAVLAHYYANLEVPYGAGLDTVRGAWRRLVKVYHPDLHSADERKKRTATEIVQGLNRAYEELARHLERK